MFPNPNVDLGTVLSLDHTTLVQDDYTYGKTLGGRFEELQLEGTVTFHNASSPPISIIVEIDGGSDPGYPINSDLVGVGELTEHVIDPGDGLSQKVLLQTASASRASNVHVGAYSVGGPAVDGDTVSLTGTGSAL